MLPLRYLPGSLRFIWTLSNRVALLRMNHFTHREVHSWMLAGG